jgi:hypothetical protein
MFPFFKKAPADPLSKLYRLTLHIKRGGNTEMPTNLVGAYVPVFIGAKGEEEAATKAVQALTNQGFEFIGIADNKIHEIDPKLWSKFVQDAWAEFTSVFPTQPDVISKLQAQAFLFIGPFAGYEANGA